MTNLFTAPGAWSGGYFELSLEYPCAATADHLRAADALWKHETLQGCYLRRDREPGDQERVTPGAEGKLLGLASPPGSRPLPCAAYWIPGDDATTWLTLGIPMGALAWALHVGSAPFGPRRPEGWREPVSGWLRDVAGLVHAAAPFEMGLIGWETDDAGVSAARVRSIGIPEVLFHGLLVPEGGHLRWVPPNRGDQATLGPQGI